MTKHLAERQMEIVLSRINGFDYRPVRVATFGEFIERWKTEVLTKQQPSSARAVTSHLMIAGAAPKIEPYERVGRNCIRAKIPNTAR